MTLRVIVAYTGGVGSAVVRLVRASPAFNLVGVLVHGEDKAGRDVGEIVGIGPTGVLATRDVDALLALKADVLSWHGVQWNSEVIARFLRAGTHVYTGIGGWFLPGEPDYQLIQEAGAQGRAALIGGGNIPGLISDVLPLFASGYSANVRFIRARQANHVAGYPSAYQLEHYLDFGKELPAKPPSPDEPLSVADTAWLWSIAQSAQIVARGLGIPYDETRLTKKEFGESPADVVLASSGLAIRKGRIGGSRRTFTAYSRGKPFYELVNEQTAQLGLGSDWRQREDEPNWRVAIEGSPSIEVSFGLTGQGEARDHVVELNAARAVNLLPRLAASGRTGWCTVLDLPAAAGLAEAALLA